jgi:hypothetical protein
MMKSRRQSCSDLLGADHQPPPPPPPPPPPDEPPPPEPLLEPGAVDAELTLLASEEPTLRVNPLTSFHGWRDPEYQVNPCCPWAAAAASTPANRRPAILDPERDRIGQIALEQLGRIVGRGHPVEPLALGDRQILLEAGDPVEDLAALPRWARTSTRSRKE